jgi:hypothetical protein
MFILRKSHYSKQIVLEPHQLRKSYFGIVPVGRLHTPALDRILFFGEAGQSNPAATATALTRMLLVYQELAATILFCLEKDKFRREQLVNAIPECMTPMNRRFQEVLFDSLITFNSDDFRRLVLEMKDYPPDIINDMIFAKFNFRRARIMRVAVDALRGNSVLGRHVLKSFLRSFRF